MEKASRVLQQLAAWGYRGTTIQAEDGRVLYLREEVASALSPRDMEILGITPKEDDKIFDNPRLQKDHTSYKAFNL